MKTCKRFVLGLIMVCFVLFGCIKDAHAYLDPGTGNFIVQILLGIVVGAAYGIKIFWIKIKNFFKKMFSSKKDK